MKTSDKKDIKNDKGFKIPDEKEMKDSWENYESQKNDFPAPDMPKVWNNINNNIDDTPVKPINSHKKYLRYAAAILLPIAIAIGYYFSNSSLENSINFQTKTAANGERLKVELPDGSSVWLQPGASIKYPETFNAENRLVTFNGMGYFKVQHNPEKPFTVEVDEVKVKVLGTQFYIKHQKNSSTVETGLVSGKVKITVANEELELAPNEVSTYQKQNQTLSKNSSLNTSSFKWENGKMVFENCELTTVLNEMAEWYNVDLKVESEEIMTEKITLTIKEESLKEIMDILKMVSPVKYTINDNQLSVTAGS